MNFLAWLTLGQPAVCPRAIWTLTIAKSLCLCAFSPGDFKEQDDGCAAAVLFRERCCLDHGCARQGQVILGRGGACPPKSSFLCIHSLPSRWMAAVHCN